LMLISKHIRKLITTTHQKYSSAIISLLYMERWKLWTCKYLSYRPHSKSLSELSVPNLSDLYSLSVVCNLFPSEHSQKEDAFYQNILSTVNQRTTFSIHCHFLSALSSFLVSAKYFN
jgi:hypothetical protein